MVGDAASCFRSFRWRNGEVLPWQMSALSVSFLQSHCFSFQFSLEVWGEWFSAKQRKTHGEV